MSLDFNLSKIENWEETCYVTATEDDKFHGIKKGDRIQSPITHSLIFATMAVGFGEITEKNYKTFYARLRLFEKVNGAFLLTNDGKDPFITLEHVRKHIGLTTNAFPNKTDNQWAKDFVTSQIRSILWDANKIKEGKPVNATIGEPEKLN